MPERCQDCRKECILTRKRCANPTIRCHRKMDKQDKGETCLQTPSASNQLVTTISPTTTRVDVRPARHEKEIQTTNRNKTTIQNRTAEARFLKPRFNVADHFYVLLCTRRDEVPSISAVARSLSSPENNAPQNTLEQQELQWVLGENHAEERNGRKPQKNEIKKSIRNVHATPLSSVCGQSVNPNCSSFPAHTQHCRNLRKFTSASHQMR